MNPDYLHFDEREKKRERERERERERRERERYSGLSEPKQRR